jgi:hypothetical protein
MPHLPDDDEGDVRFDMVEVALVLAIVAVVAPGVIWWIAKLCDVVRVTLEAVR